MLSMEEFGHGMRRICPLSEEDLELSAQVFDTDGNGQVDYAEFSTFVETGHHKLEYVHKMHGIMQETDASKRRKAMTTHARIHDKNLFLTETQSLRDQSRQNFVGSLRDDDLTQDERHAFKAGGTFAAAIPLCLSAFSPSTSRSVLSNVC